MVKYFQGVVRAPPRHTLNEALNYVNINMYVEASRRYNILCNLLYLFVSPIFTILDNEEKMGIISTQSRVKGSIFLLESKVEE